MAAAVIRLVSIGGEPYWRVVTGEPDRARRRLIGYWGSLDEAEHNAIAWWEQHAPTAWLATGTDTFRTPRSPTPWKAPPTSSPSWSR